MRYPLFSASWCLFVAAIRFVNKQFRKKDFILPHTTGYRSSKQVSYSHRNTRDLVLLSLPSRAANKGFMRARAQPPLQTLYRPGSPAKRQSCEKLRWVFSPLLNVIKTSPACSIRLPDGSRFCQVGQTAVITGVSGHPFFLVVYKLPVLLVHGKDDFMSSRAPPAGFAFPVNGFHPSISPQLCI